MQHNLNSRRIPLRVGVIGYSEQPFDQNYARAILLNQFGELKEKEGTNIDIVSGLTWLGVPGLAYEVATALDLRTIGICCKKAGEFELFPCDEVFLVGEDWGDDSDFFLSNIDMLIRIGGGDIARRECAQAKERGFEVIEFELAAIAA